MNVLAIYAVNEHLADLLAEAASERKARARRPKGRGLVASIIDTVRKAKGPAVPKLVSYPRS